MVKALRTNCTMSSSSEIEPDPDDQIPVRRGLCERLEGRLDRVVPQEAHDQLGVDPEPPPGLDAGR